MIVVISTQLLAKWALGVSRCEQVNAKLVVLLLRGKRMHADFWSYGCVGQRPSLTVTEGTHELLL